MQLDDSDVSVESEDPVDIAEINPLTQEMSVRTLYRTCIMVITDIFHHQHSDKRQLSPPSFTARNQEPHLRVGLGRPTDSCL